MLAAGLEISQTAYLPPWSCWIPLRWWAPWEHCCRRSWGGPAAAAPKAWRAGRRGREECTAKQAMKEELAHNFITPTTQECRCHRRSPVSRKGFTHFRGAQFSRFGHTEHFVDQGCGLVGPPLGCGLAGPPLVRHSGRIPQLPCKFSI